MKSTAKDKSIAFIVLQKNLKVILLSISIIKYLSDRIGVIIIYHYDIIIIINII